MEQPSESYYQDRKERASYKPEITEETQRIDDLTDRYFDDEITKDELLAILENESEFVKEQVILICFK